MWPTFLRRKNYIFLTLSAPQKLFLTKYPQNTIFGHFGKWPTLDYLKSIRDPTPGHYPLNLIPDLHIQDTTRHTPWGEFNAREVSQRGILRLKWDTISKFVGQKLKVWKLFAPKVTLEYCTKSYILTCWKSTLKPCIIPNSYSSFYPLYDCWHYANNFTLYLYRFYALTIKIKVFQL